MSVRILQGDMREKLAELADESIDAIVTDPPYGLKFMGMDWDSPGGTGDFPMRRTNQLNTVNTGVSRQGGRQRSTEDFAKRQAKDMRAYQEWLQECATLLLRVAKPGAHLLMFGGSRTFHRLFCAVEDAGWEIRDTLMWIHGSGFPKSHNLDDNDAFCWCAESHSAVQSMRDGNSHLPVQAKEGEAPDVRQNVRGEDAVCRNPATSRAYGRTGELVGADAQGVQGAHDRTAQSGVEGRGDVPPPEGRLSDREIRQGAGLGAADGAQGRLCDGASAGDGGMGGPLPDADGSGASQGSRRDKQSAQQPRTLAGQPEPQTGGAWPTCRGCGKPIIPRGLGTALKPAFEPILMARKSLIGTVAENLQAHRVGALNIEACRVSTSDDLSGGAYNESGNRTVSPSLSPSGMNRPGATAGAEFVQPAGRWPANVLHDGSDEVIAAFPDAPGAMGNVSGNEPSAPAKNVYGTYGRSPASNLRGDSGSAARFFWCPKASRRDRNEGLEGMPRKAVNWSSGEQSPGTFQSPNTDRENENFHPTVKPTELMQYLIRLVTPRGGIVLDPFMGSGSTGKAAVREGMSFVGIEIDEKYIEIARRRIIGVAPLFAEVASA